MMQPNDEQHLPMPLPITTNRCRTRRRHGTRQQRRSLLFEQLEDRRLLTVFVTNTDDSGPGSLRQAIIDANAASSSETIEFNIPSTDANFEDIDASLSGGDAEPDVFVIRPLTSLPTITGSNISIIGQSQTSFLGDTNPFGPVIVVDGSLVDSVGLQISGNGNTIDSLNIQQFSGTGILIFGSSNTITRNYIGTDATGREARGGASSVGIDIFGDENTIGGSVAGRNVISGNGSHGIGLIGANNNSIPGNIIGLSAEQLMPIPNARCGIAVFNSSGTVIGDLSTDTGNVISANGEDGICVVSGSSATTIEGNSIGIGFSNDLNSTIARPNGGHGIEISSSDTSEITRNTISGNTLRGIEVHSQSTDVTIQGNYIGVGADGSTPIGNTGGISIIDSSIVLIGGTTTASRNVVSGNDGPGIFVFRDSTDVMINGNMVGTDASGAAIVGNSNHGIEVRGASNVSIEGSQAVDLNAWEVIQYDVDSQADANWIIDSENNSVRQTVNADVSIFLSDFTLADTSIAGSLRVDTTDDDDLIGFVFGYQDDQHFYLFDWKQTDQNDPIGLANAGMSVKRVNADSPLTGTDFWQTDGVSGRVDTLFHNDIPWQEGIDYQFQLELAAGQFTIVISDSNGVIETIAINDDTDVNGRFGFYNYSQSDVVYSQFTRRQFAASNVISGNGGSGVLIWDGASEVTVSGNRIGTDESGTSDFGNAGSGVGIDGVSRITVGGSDLGAGNVISGNDGRGIFIGDASAEVAIAGNLIGTNIDGSAALANSNAGIEVRDSESVTIGGLAPDAQNVISGNLAQGIMIGASDNVNVLGNHIGVNRAGDEAIANGSLGADSHGIRIEHGSTNITIGTPGAGNVISGNLSRGIGDTVVDDLTIQSNFIGTDATGTFAIPNQHDGIGFDGASNLIIGGDSLDERNVIGGNVGQGISISNGTNIDIRGNFIGTDVTGTRAFGNSVGVNVSSSDVTVANNLISGNSSGGISISGGSFVPDAVQWPIADGGNDHFYILTPARTWAISATLADSLGGHLADIVDQAENDFLTSRFGSASPWIGLTDLAIENTFVWSSGTPYDPTSFTRFNGIEPNGGTRENFVQLLDTGFWNDLPAFSFHQAIWEFSTEPDLEQIQAAFGRATITGNLVGTEANGTAPLSNQGSGLRLANASHATVTGNSIRENLNSGISIENGTNNTIGNVTAGAANVIANNGGIGVSVSGDASQGNVIRGNSIFGNAFLGIDLLGPTIDDLLDGDTGPNGLQNKPVITGVSGSTVVGRINSVPNSVFDIDVYASDVSSGIDAEGQTWLGTTSTTTNSAGDATFSVPNLSIPAGFVAATATDSAGNTSEFSVASESVVTADLAVTITDTLTTVNPGESVAYIAVVTNNGPHTITDATVSTSIDPRLVEVAYTSSSAGGATGNGNGQDLNETLTLPPRSVVTYRITATVPSDAIGTLSTSISVSLPQDAVDSDTANNSDTDTTLINEAIDPLRFVVTNTNDSGSGSLRQAILAANSSSGSDTISFNIPSSDPGFIDIDNHLATGDASPDVFRIRPLTPLPRLEDSTGGTFIAGDSQQLFGGDTNPLGTEIVIDGSSIVSSGIHGLQLLSNDNVIEGLTIQNFTGSGVVISGDENTLRGNFIGVDSTGQQPRGNQSAGVFVASTASGNVIGGEQSDQGNVISANGQGIVIEGEQTTVQGNLIGTDLTGTRPLPNIAEGIVLRAGANQSTIGGATSLVANYIDKGDDQVVGSVSQVTVTEGVSDIRGYIFDDQNGNGVRDTDLIIGNEPDIVFVLDVSGSMNNSLDESQANETATSRLDAAIAGIIELMDTLVRRGFGDEVDIAVVTFDSNARALNLDPTAAGVVELTSLTADRDGNGVFDAVQTLGNIVAGGGTNYGIALQKVDDLLSEFASQVGQANVVFFSDGVPQSLSYTDEVAALRQRGANLQAFGIGDDPTSDDALDALQIIDPDARQIASVDEFMAIFSGRDTASVEFVEPGVADRFVYVDLDQNGRFDPGEMSTRSDSSGDYSFAGLSPGTYSVVVEPELHSANVISGNGGSGIVITGADARLNQLLGNRIGTNIHGTVSLPNAGVGIVIDGGALSNTVGGEMPNVCNLVSGNTGHGIVLSGVGTQLNVIQGNRIGSDIRGAVRLPNQSGGIHVTSGASNNSIGGSLGASRNLISGNNGNGITLDGSSTRGNIVQGNYIGTNQTAATALNNAGNGVEISAGASDNIIGSGNVIAGNDGNGVLITGATTTSNLIQGNLIGTGKVRSSQIGNGLLEFLAVPPNPNGVFDDSVFDDSVLGNGVLIVGASGNVIGGTAPSEGNVIAFNQRHGVLITSGTENRIQSNSFFANYLLGIDLGGDGKTANDDHDEDTGANLLQNTPESIFAELSSAGEPSRINVAYTLRTTASSLPITVQFFLAEVDGQEGATLLGEHVLTALATDNKYMAEDLLTNANVRNGLLVATATDRLGNSSEFSDVAFIHSSGNTSQPLSSVAQSIVNEASTTIHDALRAEPDEVLPVRVTSLNIIPDETMYEEIIDIPLDRNSSQGSNTSRRRHITLTDDDDSASGELDDNGLSRFGQQTIAANDFGADTVAARLALFEGLGAELIAFIWVDPPHPPRWTVKTRTGTDPTSEVTEFDSEKRQSTPPGGARFSTGMNHANVLESIITPFSDQKTLSISLRPEVPGPYRGGVNIYALVDGTYQLNFRTTFESSGNIEREHLELVFKPGVRTSPILAFAPTRQDNTLDATDSVTTGLAATTTPAVVTTFISQDSRGGNYLDLFDYSDPDWKEELRRLLKSMLNDLKALFEELQQSLESLGKVSEPMARMLRSEANFDFIAASFSAPSTVAELTEAFATAQQLRTMVEEAWSALAQLPETQAASNGEAQPSGDAADSTVDQIGANSSVHRAGSSQTSAANLPAEDKPRQNEGIVDTEPADSTVNSN